MKTAESNRKQMLKFCPVIKGMCKGNCEFFVKARDNSFGENNTVVPAFCNYPHNK